MMMSEIFTTVNPEIVTAGFTTGFVSALSLANAGGRLGWATVSDYLGRKNTMYVCSLALPACIAVPQITSLAVSGDAPGDGSMPLFVFYGTTFAIVSWYGGVLALLPSYCADVFGPKDTPVIYGRVMSSWSVTAIGTPSLLTYLHGSATRQAIDSLVPTIPPDRFEQAFGAPVSELDALVSAKTLTIAR